MTEIKPAQKWLPGTDSIGNSRSRLFRIYELMWDVFLMIPSYFVSQLLFRGHPPSTFFLLGIGSASCALSYVFCGLFSAKHSQRGIEILIETFKLNLLGFVFAALFIWLTNLELATIILEILILQSMLLFTVSLMLGCFFRMILFSATKVSGADPYSSRALILCQSSDLHSIYEKLERSKGKNYEYAGALTIDGSQDWTTGIKILGALEDLEQVIRTEVIDDVIIVIRNFQSLDIQPYIEVCEKAGLGVHVLFDFATRALQKRFSVAGEYVSLSFCNNRLTPLQLFAKRALDIVGSIVGLIITGFVAIVIGPKIKKDKGPVFFSQIRVGENGRPFKIYKFRTMIVGAEEQKKELLERNEMDGSIFKIKDDPRVTDVGKRLREYSLDEFPQFLNVLRGEMSLVGTRPPTVEEVDGYNLEQLRRISIKPGLTGIWQINGRNEIKSFDQIMEFDLEYINKWSLLLDLKIIIKTIIVVLKKTGQ